MTIDATNILVVLMTVLLGLSSWTLYTLHGLAVAAAGRDEKDKAQDQRLEEDRARIIEVEGKVGRLEVDVSGFRSRHR
jgi:hypothetical protein